MPSFKITIAYDGTGFVGWQRQAAGTSIQGLLEEALKGLDERDVAVTGAGRTDAGVHALGQVASFTIQRVIAADALVRAINARLPDAVRVLAAEEMPPRFHARFDATRKLYRYRIWHADVLSPFERAYVWHAPGAATPAATPLLRAGEILGVLTVLIGWPLHRLCLALFKPVASAPAPATLAAVENTR